MAYRSPEERRAELRSSAKRLEHQINALSTVAQQMRVAANDEWAITVVFDRLRWLRVIAQSKATLREVEDVQAPAAKSDGATCREIAASTGVAVGTAFNRWCKQEFPD